MKENIEEDIELLEEMRMNCRTKRDYIDVKAERKANAIEHILSDYTRVLKENEELKEKYDIDIDELENLLSDTTVEMLDWRNKSIKLEAENRKLKTLIAHKNGYTEQLEQDLYENASNCVIPKQKIKDKIEEVKNEEDLYARVNIIAILLELLEEEK